jgi:hypothetical protein
LLVRLRLNLTILLWDVLRLWSRLLLFDNLLNWLALNSLSLHAGRKVLRVVEDLKRRWSLRSWRLLYRGFRLSLLYRGFLYSLRYRFLCGSLLDGRLLSLCFFHCI